MADTYVLPFSFYELSEIYKYTRCFLVNLPFVSLTISRHLACDFCCRPKLASSHLNTSTSPAPAIRKVASLISRRAARQLHSNLSQVSTHKQHLTTSPHPKQIPKPNPKTKSQDGGHVNPPNHLPIHRILRQQKRAHHRQSHPTARHPRRDRLRRPR